MAVTLGQERNKDGDGYVWGRTCVCRASSVAKNVFFLSGQHLEKCGPKFECLFRHAGASGNLVTAPAKVDAVLGKTITLGCHIQMMPNLTLIQTSWERQVPSGREVLAVYHVGHGTHISPEFAHRVSFVSTTDRDVSISVKGVELADEGSYTCKVSTFPLGNGQASTDLDVLGKDTDDWIDSIFFFPFASW